MHKTWSKKRLPFSIQGLNHFLPQLFESKLLIKNLYNVFENNIVILTKHNIVIVKCNNIFLHT